MEVSELGFGASSLGGVFHSFNENRGIDAVFAAVDAGINIIDVSPYYGYYKAEIVLGKALKDIPRNKFYLSTKVGRYGEDGHNTWDYSARRAKESVYESLERLHIDYIDIINVHDIEFQGRMEGGLQKVVDETLPALHELKAEGVVRHVGITDLQLENLRWVIEHAEPGMVESVMGLHGLLRRAQHRRTVGQPVQHGTAHRARRARLASRTETVGRSVSSCRRALQDEGIPHRETCHAVLVQQSPHCLDGVQHHPPRGYQDEHRLYRGTDG